MQSKFPLEMLRPLLRKIHVFGVNDQDFLCHSSVLSLRIIYFSLNIFLIEKKVGSYIFRYNKLKNIRFYLFYFAFYMIFAKLVAVLNVLMVKTSIR